MRRHRLSVTAIAVLVAIVVGSVGTAGAQSAPEESYWGESTLNGIFHTWPAVAIAVLTAVVMGGMVGFYELDRTTIVVALGGIGFLVYRFYWQPAHAAATSVTLTEFMRSLN
ncbi:MAG TPA: hypothetical protein VGZ23_07560 [bacterium]|nr:hypothetical protein [bacterium]